MGSQGYCFCHQEEQPLRLVAVQYRRAKLVCSRFAHSFVAGELSISGRRDNANGVQDPQDVNTTITFRGQQVRSPSRSGPPFLIPRHFRRSLLSLSV